MFVVRPIVVCFIAIGTVAVAPRAEAFCRTTTTMPVTDNTSLNGCWDGGVPLHWPLSRVPYGAVMAGSPRQKLTGTDVTRIADLAFGAWKNATCDGGTPSVEGFDDGPLASAPDASDCINSDSCDPFTHDVIVFDDDGWPYDDNTANPLALTTVSYGVKDGRIFEAKTEINSAEYAFTTATSSDAGNDAYDLQSVLTHEAGHFLGLAHATEATSIMFWQIEQGAILHLTPDDESGICTIYPPAGPSSCSCTPRRTESSSSYGQVALIALCALRMRRRSRSRCRAAPHHK